VISRESLLTLIAELEGDAAEIERVLEHNREAWQRVSGGADGVVDLGALAFTIHTTYGVLENYFLRISKVFENNLSLDRWHRELVEKMTLDVPELRPPFLVSTKSKQQVLELVKFRHRVRNLYGEDLDRRQISAVQHLFDEFFTSFPQLHVDFTSKLQAIANAI
jgi:hypothetical protein